MTIGELLEQKQVEKQCACCGRAVNRSNSQYVGIQATPEEMSYELELYNCLCGSTFAFKREKRV